MATQTSRDSGAPRRSESRGESSAWRPQEVEPELYRRWEAAGLFRADPHDPRPKFSIVMPPPNITGELHLGHATNGTLQDVYCRYKRMRGFEVLWLPGTDHAAIATQNVIEKLLAREGTSKEQIGREAFDGRVQRWYADVGARIVEQLKRLGVTADWSRQRFTMDAAYVRAIREAFVRLYQRGYIYRGPRIVNWCPRCRSSISDLEVDWREHEDVLYHVRYDMADGGGALVVATVRPETMLADTAVAVNPRDARYTGFVGRRAILPLVGRELPVIADDYVKTDFGSGALKVTPGHDPNDYEIGRRHDLEILSCIDKDGSIVEDGWVPEELRSLNSLDARRRVVELLRESDHLVGTEPYVHEVGHCDRCGEVIEPLVDEQWWCAMTELAKPAIEVVESGRIKFYPERWGRVYLDWMRNLRDWNVSRQLWLGHRIPVYYCDAGHGDELMEPVDGAVAPVSETHAFVSVEEPAACPVCGSAEIRQDPDVLDTWFSSALWPFATMGWPEETEDLRTFHPTDILGTDRGIIFLWVARMILTDLEFLGQIPFHTVLIHATIQAKDGRRMSKSLGTGVDPLEMVDRYGADALRAWAAEVAVSRQDVRFDEERIEAYGRFANKLWNVARLTLGAAGGVELVDPGELAPALTIFDRWILSRAEAMVEQVTAAIEEYRPGDGITALYDFVWHELADWYLEAAKPRFREDAKSPGRIAAASVAMAVLDTAVRLLHPYMPFVTEAIWEQLPWSAGQPLSGRSEAPLWPDPARGEPIMRQMAGAGEPGGRQPGRDARLEDMMAGLLDVVREIRDARKQAAIQDRVRVRATARRISGDVSEALVDSDEGIAAISHLASIDLAPAAGSAAPASASTEEASAAAPAPGGGVTTVHARGLEIAIQVPRAESGGDRAALERQAARAREEIEGLTARLGGEFAAKAPQAVVARERERLAGARERLSALEAALARAGER